MDPITYAFPHFSVLDFGFGRVDSAVPTVTLHDKGYHRDLHGSISDLVIY